MTYELKYINSFIPWGPKRKFTKSEIFICEILSRIKRGTIQKICQKCGLLSQCFRASSLRKMIFHFVSSCSCSTKLKNACDAGFQRGFIWMITTTNSVHRLKRSNPVTSQSKSADKSKKCFTQVKHQVHLQKKSWQKQSPQNLTAV